MATKFNCELIRSRRKDLNITQEQLAEQIGCNSRSVQRWESGKGLCNSTHQILLAKALSIYVNDLYLAEEEKHD